MSQLLENTDLAFNLFLEGELNQYDLMSLVEEGIISGEVLESMLEEGFVDAIKNNPVARGVNKVGKLAFDTTNSINKGMASAVKSGAKTFHSSLMNSNKTYNNGVTQLKSGINKGRNALADKLVSLSKKVRP